MSFLSSLNISASALTAQRQRLDIISENIANIDTTRTEGGGPYRRKMVVLRPNEQDTFRKVLSSKMQKAKGGVHVEEIVEDERDFKPVYNPEHPDADENGYVMMPNVELVKETIDAMSASRSYDANVTVFNTMKLMAQKALEVGK
ncbi:MAG: flagellar basal body rod protein FlgC [Peptostreptococcaceae bacterium]|nr:flagellar basal body rod protein FlgC [Peptostreptococcaceae bacterium]